MLTEFLFIPTIPKGPFQKILVGNFTENTGFSRRPCYNDGND